MENCTNPGFGGKYYKISVNLEREKCKNEIFTELLLFIGTHCNVSLPCVNKMTIEQENSKVFKDYNKKLAHAYRAIKIETNKILGIGLFSLKKTSNKEIQSIRLYYKNIFNFKQKKEIVLKIPYKIMCIFLAIANILKEIKKITGCQFSVSGRYEKFYQKQIQDFYRYVELLDRNNLEDFDRKNIEMFENVFSAPGNIFQRTITF